MQNTVLTFVDYIMWCITSFITLCLAVKVLYTLRMKSFKGFMPMLVMLIICENFCAILFQILFWAFPSTDSDGEENKPNMIAIGFYSFAIGGEISSKSISLWLFASKYLKSCLEMPVYTMDSKGQIQIQLSSDRQYDAHFKIVNIVGVVLILFMWTVITCGYWLFFANGRF